MASKVVSFFRDRLIPATSLALTGNVGAGIGTLLRKPATTATKTTTGGTLAPSGIVLAQQTDSGLKTMLYDADKKAFVANNTQAGGSVLLIGGAALAIMYFMKRK